MDRKTQAMTWQPPFLHTLAAASIGLLPSVAAAGHDAKAGVDAMALYNQGAAVVQDMRELSLDKGDQQIAWPVTGRLRPDTLWLQGKGVRLAGFNANATSNGRRDPLAARMGQSVTLVREDAGAGTSSRAATLLAQAGDAVYVRVDNRVERITAESPWQITWPVDAAQAKAKPSGDLDLDIDADSAGKTRLTATYQIDGPSWQASYTGRFDAQIGTLSLQSMAVIDNSGGARLVADEAWLVAGDVARANGAPRPMMMARSDAKMSESAPQATGDTYRYALDGPLEVPAGGVRAVSMLGPVSFEAKRRYRVENSWYGRTGDTRSHAEVRLAFDNSSDQPLPAGVIRVYDGRHQAQLIGEDRIDDTPTKAPVTLMLGRSFDVTAERRVVSDSDADSGRRRRKLAIVLHNAGAQDARVDVIEHLVDRAEIVYASKPPASGSEANVGEWQLDVPAGSQARLTYTVQWPAGGE